MYHVQVQLVVQAATVPLPLGKHFLDAPNAGVQDIAIRECLLLVGCFPFFPAEQRKTKTLILILSCRTTGCVRRTTGLFIRDTANEFHSQLDFHSLLVSLLLQPLSVSYKS